MQLFRELIISNVCG